jgi:hypothetical protein
VRLLRLSLCALALLTLGEGSSVLAAVCAPKPCCKHERLKPHACCAAAPDEAAAVAAPTAPAPAAALSPAHVLAPLAPAAVVAPEAALAFAVVVPPSGRFDRGPPESAS